jgi:hypothetical protein
MKGIFAALIVLVLAPAFADDAKPGPKVIQCSGQTTVTVNHRQIAQSSPFSAVFVWDGDVVTVRGFNQPGFADSYKAWGNEPLEGRKSFGSDRGNLFFFIDSGRFEIFLSEILPELAMRERVTNGTCEPYRQSDVFK